MSAHGRDPDGEVANPQGDPPMPLILAIAFVALPLVVLAIAVRQTIRIEALRGGYPTVSLTYRAYGA
jgi:hypothetical protein